MTTAEQEAPTEIVTPSDLIRERLGVEPPTANEWLKMMLFGETGVGKTHFCGTVLDHPDLFPAFFIDCEGGKTTLRKRKNLDTRQARTIADLQKYHKELFMHNRGWYKTVIVDSGSEVQDVDIRMIMKETKDNARNPDLVDIDVPSPREWGKTRNHMRTIIRGYRDLPMNFIFTCLLDERHEPGDKEQVKPTRFYPALQGKFRTEASAFMDVVGYYRKEDKDKRIMQFASTKRVPTVKTRFPELGDSIENPTLPMIWEIVKNASAEDHGTTG
jgi:hypothetical protein